MPLWWERRGQQVPLEETKVAAGVLHLSVLLFPLLAGVAVVVLPLLALLTLLGRMAAVVVEVLLQVPQESL
jgi:hypothetical protein